LRIKKLELVGFKSFKDRTVIHFDAGITGVVGPNGCGKSNIVDALMWVMGEMSAKHLRGSSMEDVIFAGADGYSPMGMAEVSLTLENDGGPFPIKYLSHSEIMVTRRLHRSGESEYLINKEGARLRDIQEIFMDTGAGAKGFSIIEQGAIGKIVTAKPEERRSLIEEAAGITKFKVRKRESQRKLEATEGNLVRLQDIIGELKRQLESLQRQAQRAERYRRLRQEIETLELWLSSVEYKKLKEKTESAELSYVQNKDRDFESAGEIGQLEATLQTLKADLAERERLTQAKQLDVKALNDAIREKEKNIQELHFEIEQARRNKEMTGNLTEESLARKTALMRDVDNIEQRLAELTTRMEQVHTDYISKKQVFDEKQSRIRELDIKLTDSRRELISMVQAETTLEARVQGLQDSIQSLVEEEAEAQNLSAELNTQFHSIEKNHKTVSALFEKERQLQLSVMNDIEALSANKDHLASDLKHREQEISDYKDKLNEVASRLYGLEDLQNNFEGFQEGVKAVMLWQRQKTENLSEAEREANEKFTPVADVVEVPREYELAMEAALGPRLQLLLSKEPENSIEAIDFLKNNKTGRSSFYSGLGLHTVTTEDIEPLRADSRVQVLLKDVATIPEAHRSVVETILDRVAVVDSLVSGLELKKTHPYWTFVTTDGDLITEDGIMTGGSAEDASTGVLKRQREIKELKQSKDEWASKLSLAQMTCKKVQSSYEKLIADLERAQKDHTEKEIMVASLRKDLERAESEMKNSTVAMEKHQAEMDRVQEKLAERRNDLSFQTNYLQELRAQKLTLETDSNSATTELTEARASIESLQEEVTSLQVLDAKVRQEKEGAQRESDVLHSALEEVDGRLNRMSSEALKSGEFVSQNQIILEEKKLDLDVGIRRVKEEEEMVAQMRDAFEDVSAEVREIQEKYTAIITAKSQLQANMNEAQLQLEQARMRESNLVEHIRERYQLELSEIYTQHLDHDGDESQAQGQLKELKDKISKIGEVNLSAIEEYDDISNRYEFLSKQYTDLIDAKEQLKKVIDRINRICSRRFKETYEAVNERFQKVFPVLFGGGEARLILIEDTEKGEMGLDIVAKPPGKKLQSVSLLSGGEKALTAVSLIFSIFLVKPSPYCLLDEVDAPLDDANVMRFNELVREMAKRSQIIVVTHNKFTMEIAEKLYGVTMEEKGVSKMVSVDISTRPDIRDMVRVEA
jgi:chromosome segregation protein